MAYLSLRRSLVMERRGALRDTGAGIQSIDHTGAVVGNQSAAVLADERHMHDESTAVLRNQSPVIIDEHDAVDHQGPPVVADDAAAVLSDQALAVVGDDSRAIAGDDAASVL